MTQSELVEKIKCRYINLQKEEDKFEQLKKLDSKAKMPARVFGYTFGTLASLVLGTGMSLAMKIIGASVGALMPVGIAVGAVGIALMSITYPIYKKLLAKGKKKYGQQIIEKSNEILNEGE
ncbi:MAG: dihydropteridine reductase [Clostridia bacterium]|nr:dihydropteridine reductase [Clostridia bacterium]MBQ8792135.1 dihydropteridine reductase [Clostridia bacterium]